MILFVDGSCHLKTKSYEFLAALLRKHDELRFAYIEDMTKAQIRELASGKYDATIFLQINPAFYIDYFAGHNIVFVPMYDTFFPSRPRDFYFLKHIKWLCFSRSYGPALDRKGIRHLDVQYWPELAREEAEEAEDGTYFFWQRREDISWETVKALLPTEGVQRVHIHKALDPGYSFVAPSAEDEARYSIRYSEWFDDKAGLIDAVKRCRYYFAPRRKEGVGLSFLDAMALGRTVIAPNDATMNEYVVDGVNGYLYDPDDPRPLHLSDSVGTRSVVESVRRGRREWEGSEPAILDFIHSAPERKRYFMNYQTLRDLARPVRNILHR